MAKNGPNGGGRIGAVRGCSQTKNPKTQTWSKRNTSTGKFMDGKADGQPLKAVERRVSAPLTGLPPSGPVGPRRRRGLGALTEAHPGPPKSSQ